MTNIRFTQKNSTVEAMKKKVEERRSWREIGREVKTIDTLIFS